MSFIGNTPTQQAFTAAVDVFSGNGSTTAFTLSRPVASVAQVEAVIENVQQSPVDAYTVNGNTITFTSAPPSGTSNIYVRYTSPITQVIAPSDGAVGTSQLANGAVTAAKIANGAVGTAALGVAAVTSATMETLVQPLGVGQTWQDVKASRAYGTTYTNSTGRPIYVYVYNSISTNGTFTITVNGVTWGGYHYAAGNCGTPTFIVPSGGTYSISTTASLTVANWMELR